MRTKSHRDCYPLANAPRFMVPRQAIPCPAPLGPRCIAFLRRVRAAGSHYTIVRNADRDALAKALSAGFVARVGKSREDVRLTAAGAAYLDRLARVE